MTENKQPKKVETQKSKKGVVLITYVIALVCLLLGLLLPFTNGSSLLVTMLPSAFNNVFGTTLSIGTDFAYSNTVNFFGLFNLDFNSLLVLLYALITVVGIILLIPACISKKKKTAFACAATVEIIASIILSIYVMSLVGYYATDNISVESFTSKFPFDWAVICVAFVGTIVMLCIQALNYHKRNGSVRFIMWLLSAVAVFCLFSVRSLTYVLQNASLLIKVDGVNVSGLSIVNYFVTGTFGDTTSYYFNNIGAEATNFGSILSIILSLGIMLVILNYIIDFICLGAKTTKGVVVFDFLRYLVEFALFVAAIIMLYIMRGALDCDVKPATMIFIIAAAALLSMLIALAQRADAKAAIRAEIRKGRKNAENKAEDKKENASTDENDEPIESVLTADGTEVAIPAGLGAAASVANGYAPVVAGTPGGITTSPIYITFYPNYAPVAPAAPAAPMAPYAPYVPAPGAAPTVSYNPPAPQAYHSAPASAAPAAVAAPAEPLPEPYSGPTDSFIDKLTETEKLEFESIFIKKEKGDFGIPDYKIGCNNKDFFNGVFLRLAKFRALLSEGLLAKIYDETD